MCIRDSATPRAGLVLGRDAVLDGALELILAPGQTLASGDRFELALYAAPAEFRELILPPPPDGLAWTTAYGPSALTAEVVVASPPASH